MFWPRLGTLESGDHHGRCGPDITRQLSVAVENSRAVPLADLPVAPSAVAPPSPSKKTSRPPKTVQKIQYDVPIDRFRKVATTLGINVITEIGRRTFDYFFDREVDD
jgi:hypothetical protein